MSEQEVLRSTSQSIPSTFDSFMDGQLKDFDTFMTAGTKDFDSFMGTVARGYLPPESRGIEMAPGEERGLLAHGPISQEEIDWYKKKGWPYPGEQYNTLIAEKPDQATIDRMRFVEKGVPFMPTSLGTVATTAVKQLAETPVGIIKGGIEGARAIIQGPKEILPAMREAYDYATSPEGQKDIIKAGYEDTKGLVFFLPKTLINFAKNPQKQVTEDPVGTIFLFGAVGGGAAKLASRKLRAKTPLAPEEIKSVVAEIAPDQATIAKNTETLKAMAEPEPRVAPIEVKAPAVAPIVEPPGIDIRVSRDTVTGDTVIRIPKEAPKAVTESPQTPVSLPAEGPTVVPEPKRQAGGYPPTGEIVPPQEAARLRGIAEDKARWEKEHAGVRKHGSLQTFMEMPIEETRASAEYGVAEAKQALAVRMGEKPQPLPTGEPSGIPAAEYVKHKASGTLFRVLDNRNPASVTVDNNGKPMVLDRKYVEPVEVAKETTIEKIPEFTEADAKAKAEVELAKPKKPSFVMPERIKKVKTPITKLTQEQMLQINDAVEKNTTGKGVPRKWRDFDDEATWEANRQELKEYLIENYKANSVEMQKNGLDPVRLQSAVNRLKGFFQGGENLTRKVRETKLKTDQPKIEETETGKLEVEPTVEMAKGEATTKGKKTAGEQEARFEREAVIQRREKMLDEIEREFDAKESEITDPSEKAMFRVYREGLSGKPGEKELKARGTNKADDTLNKRIKEWESEMRERISAKAEGIVDKVKKEIEFDDSLDEMADKGIGKDYENWQKQREGGFVVVPVPGGGSGATAAKVKKGLNNFYQDVFDRFHAIKRVAQIAKDDGVNVPVHRDPYIKARNYLGVQAMAEEKIFYRRFKIDENTGKVVWGEKSLQDIVKPHKKEMDKWDTYLVARHSPEVAARGLKTGRDITVDKAFVDKYAPQFEADAKEFTAYLNSLLKELVDAGRLKEETYRELTTRYPNYASFNRVIDEVVEHGYVPSSAKLLSKIPNPIKRLKGSERPIISPTESAIKATYVITNIAERQRIAKSIFDLREQSPELKNVIKLIKPKMDLVATLEDGTKIFRPSSFQKEGVIEYFEKGQRHFYEVPKDIYESMSQLTEMGHSWMIKILAAPSRLLRAGSTLVPDFFMGTNPFRDQTTAFLNAKYGYVPWFDFIKGLFDLVKKPEGYHAWRASGGEWSMLVSLDRATNQATLKKVLGEKDYTRYLKKPWTFLEDVSMYGERPTRLSVFREARKRTSDVEAAFQSREASVDFARRGAATRSVSAIYTFLNARVQGTDKLIRTFRENPAQAMLKGVSIAALPSLTLYLINRSDDKYWEIPEWQRRMFWMIPVGGGHYFRIPKGEIGVIFGTTTEMIMENLDKDHTTKKRIDQMAMNIIKELSPAGNLGEIMPTAFRPIMEWFFNKNFFTGQPVVSRSEEGIKPEYQYAPRTPETAKAIGKVVGASPSKIENLTRGYLGGMSNYIFTVGDAVLEEVRDKIAKAKGEPAPKRTELPSSMKKVPVLKTFTVNDPTGFNSDSVTKFYDAFGKLDEFKRTFDKLKKQGQTDELKHLVKSDPLGYKAVSMIIPGKDGDTTLYKDFSRATTSLSAYRKQRITIIESNLPVKRKEELINKLDELILQSVIPVLAKYRGVESWLKKGD